MSVAVPKTAYVRDQRLRDMCRAMHCQWCLANGPGVTWAHSNQHQHGKGRSIKASDIYVAALCDTCHRRVDQGSESSDIRRTIWQTAHERTVILALQISAWPRDVPLPGWAESWR